jgi:uncharacterized protein YkwD
MRALYLSFLLSTISLPAIHAEHPLGTVLPSSHRKAVADQLAMPDPAKRAGAVLRFRVDGPEAADDFRAGLTRAENAALGNLRRLLQMVKPTDPAFEVIRKLVEDHRVKTEAASALILTDHHKDKKKHAEMDKAYDAAEKAHERLMRALRPAGSSSVVQLLDAVQWVAEIRRDLLFCDGRTAEVSKLPMTEVLQTEGVPEVLLQFVREMEPTIALREFHRQVTLANSAMRWARPEQVQYANILNARRVAVGLPPFILSERLSAASGQHSEEMVKMGYFAHESPVPENKTPADRARNAKFEGNSKGECITNGPGSAQASHESWWYSDGHRLILYGGGNCQGIAKFGKMWTFMTGDFGKYPL